MLAAPRRLVLRIDADRELLELPDLDHRFQTCASGAMSENLRIHETFRPVAVETIERWRAARLARSQGAPRPARHLYAGGRMAAPAILWRRLDAPGHDACRLEASGPGPRLEGAAVFLHGDLPARLVYEVECDRLWRSRRGSVRGWIGARAVAISIERSAEGAWSLDGRTVAGLEDCADLDLGFTPATNLLALRRLDLAIGGAARAPAAWLDVDSVSLERLPQDYARVAVDRYAYASPLHGYAAELEVAPSGFVVRYPGLWEAVVRDGG